MSAGIAMEAKPRLDPKIKAHALRSLKGEIGGTIKGSKLYPLLDTFFVDLIAKSAEAVVLRRRSYICQVAAQREGDVVEALRKAGLDAYCPMEPKSRRVNAVKRAVVQSPMLPGYVFPIFDEHRDNWQIIRREQNGQGIKGIIRLFKVGERPVPVPEGAIQFIHDQEQHALVYGKSLKHAPIPAKFAPGNWVQMIDMPWTGYIVQVDSWVDYKARLRVAIDIFGRCSLVEVSVNQVRAV